MHNDSAFKIIQLEDTVLLFKQGYFLNHLEPENTSQEQAFAKAHRFAEKLSEKHPKHFIRLRRAFNQQGKGFWEVWRKRTQ